MMYYNLACVLWLSSDWVPTTMQILSNTVGLIFLGLALAHLIPFRITGLIPEIPDFGIRYRFAMSALFPSPKSGPKAVLCVVSATLIVPQSKSLAARIVFKECCRLRLIKHKSLKKSAAVCVSLSTNVLDYSIFRLIMHTNPDFAAFYMNKNPGIYRICSLNMHKILELNSWILQQFLEHHAQKS